MTACWCLQINYYNPATTSAVDSSGMVVYYTTNLRPNDGQLLPVRQLNFEIPAGQASYAVNGTCTKYCTSVLTQTMFISGAMLYMQSLGMKVNRKT
jgi:hypothetical protein